MSNTTKTDFGFESVTPTEKTQRVGQVFSNVAARYDIMNDVMSLGVHRWWKRHTVATSGLRPGQRVLDLAGGSGDLTRLVLKKVMPGGQVVLSDINAEMLSVGRRNMTDAGCVDAVKYAQINAEIIPFPDNYFDRVFIGFGLRNVTQKEKALAEMCRVLKPGGRAIILEFSKLQSQPLAKLYDEYSFKLIPKLGGLIADDEASYQYLVESIRMHPDQETLKSMMLSSGFDEASYQNLSGGVVAIHTGIKY